MAPRTLPTRQRGLAAIETALAAPLFLLLMMGVAEFGRAFYEFNTLSKAVRNGARYLAERAATGAGVIDITAADAAAARNLVVYGNAAGGSAPLLRGLTPGDVEIVTVDASHFRIVADYDYQPIFAVLPSFGSAESVDAPSTMVASYTMRAQ